MVELRKGIALETDGEDGDETACWFLGSPSCYRIRNIIMQGIGVPLGRRVR